MEEKNKCKPVNILDITVIQRGTKRQSKYELRLQALQQLLEPIKDTEVVVIGIIGAARRGKSFILNYMHRFLIDPNNPHWMGKENEPLQGFKWLSSEEPQTFGIWFSKPIIMKQSNGKDLAIILMDTQGLFDDMFQPRDWSTIAGISLLVSSCLIVNLFTNISEEMLTFFDTYINYGLKATDENNASDEENRPFQSLLFLVRDWNIPNQFRYGLNGGKQYLEKKLVVTETQSPQAQNVRQNIKKCFKDLSCYLMPTFGDVMENEEFDGSVGQLKDRFREKLEEFVTKIMNPEEMIPKTIDGTPITGEELLQQIQSVVEVFNREEMPDSQHILEANAKLSDNIFIRKLRDLHLSQMRNFIESKPFVTRSSLEKQNKVYRTEIIEDFEGSMKSSNTKLADKLSESLKKNFSTVFDENEERRKVFIRKCVENCGEQFTDSINKEFSDNKFVDSETFEELIRTYETQVFDNFELNFFGEDNNLFVENRFELTQFIHNSERAARITNHERIKDFESTKDKLVNNVTDYYQQKMTQLLTDNVFLSKDFFRDLETEIREQTKSKFSAEYNFGNQAKNEIFELKINQKLNELKNTFKDKNKDKCSAISVTTEKIIGQSINFYEHEMKERFDLIKTVEDFENSHKSILKKSHEILNTCPFQESYFFEGYVNTFNSAIIRLYNDFKTKLIEKKQKQNKIYDTALNEALLIFKNGMNESFDGKKFPTIELLNRQNRIQQRSAIKKFEESFTGASKQDPLYREYLLDLKEKISEEFDILIENCEQNQRSDENRVELLLKQLKDDFNARINETLESVSNYNQLLAEFDQIKNSLKRKLSENNEISDKSLINNSLIDLETVMRQRFTDIITQFDIKKENTFKEYQYKIIQSKDDYKMKMDSFLTRNEYITDHQLKHFHEITAKQIKLDLDSKLKPVFDFDIQSLINKSEQLISDELQSYLRIIADIRNKKSDSVKTKCQQFIGEYETKIIRSLESVKTVEELKQKHKEISNIILDSTRKSSAISDENLITIQLNHISSEIAKIFDKILNEFVRKLGKIEDKCQLIFKQSKNFYEKEIESLFENRETYEKERLNKLQSKSKVKTINNFVAQLRDNDITNDNLKTLYSKKLNDFIEDSNLKCNQKNQENIMYWNDCLEHSVDGIKNQYKQSMNKFFGSINNERELRTKHFETMTLLLNELTDKFKNMDITIVLLKKDHLRDFMEKELSLMSDRIHGKFEQIFAEYRNVSERLLQEYCKKMNETVENNYITNEELLNVHRIKSAELIEKFDNYLRDNPSNEIDKYSAELKKSIEYQYRIVSDKLIRKKEEQNNNLENLIKELDQMYENGMDENLKKFKTIDELKKCHKESKERLIKSFAEMSDLKDPTLLKDYSEKLESMFEKSYSDNEYLLELRLKKEEQLCKILNNDIRRHYKEEMETFLQNKLFIPKNLLKSNHKIVSKNTVKKFEPEKGHLTQQELDQFVNDSVSDLFKKIDEDNDMRRPTSSIAIGIDLGTTNSCVAFFDAKSRLKNNIAVIPNELGRSTTPSVVSYRDEGVIVVGDVAKDDNFVYPRNTISSAKRLIGQHFSSISVAKDLWSYQVVNGDNDLPMISVKVDGQEKRYFAEQVSSEVLKKLKKSAENHLGCDVTKAVITVPAYFNDAQREATKQAGKLAGLDVLRIINEPTAAAIAFKVDRNDESEIRKVLIYDFGGGTFDVSLLEINKGNINVLAVDGNNHLGGDDFDTALINHCLVEFQNKNNIQLQGNDREVAICRLRSQCEEHKKRLSSVESTNISIDNFHDCKDLSVEVTRAKFEELVGPLIVDSIELVKEVLKTKQISVEDINDIVLVGGSTRIPKVQQSLSEVFNGRSLNHSVNPDEAVAKGAAIQAALLNGQQSDGFCDIKLNDVTPLSLGVEVITGMLEIVIPRNTRIPTHFTKPFYKALHNQTSVNIRIFEGEMKMAKDNHKLGQFILDGIPPGPPGKEPIDVTFTINEEGILDVKAKIVSTGSEDGIEITEHKGRLTTEMIEKILKDNNK